MTTPVWVLTAALPEGNTVRPITGPRVFTTYEAAYAAFDMAMRCEWETLSMDEDYPGDPDEAVHAITDHFNRTSDKPDEQWGAWSLDQTTLEV